MFANITNLSKPIADQATCVSDIVDITAYQKFIERWSIIASVKSAPKEPRCATKIIYIDSKDALDETYSETVLKKIDSSIATCYSILNITARIDTYKDIQLRCANIILKEPLKQEDIETAFNKKNLFKILNIENSKQSIIGASNNNPQNTYIITAQSQNKNKGDQTIPLTFKVNNIENFQKEFSNNVKSKTIKFLG